MKNSLLLGLVICALPCNTQTDSTNVVTLNKEPIQLKEVVVKSQSVINKADKIARMFAVVGKI